ncbi:Bromodomain adjacent to zinc finger domain protein 1A, partial [Sarcoptes scabiei]
MPLLGKEPFPLKSLPKDVSLNDQIFFSEITKEPFFSYDEFYERHSLYNSLLWTCSVTGKTGLTYLQALKSESDSRNLLSTIPNLLQKILLHLMTYLKNFSTNVTLSLLTEFTNFRFFIGETIQISLSNNRKSKGVIRDVIPPDDEESSNSVSYGLDPMSYKYVVESTNEIKQKIYETISASKISRPKFLLTREKIRLFLRQHLAPKNGRYDSLSIKEESARLFSLDTLRWNDIFKGPPPKFDSDTISVKISIKQRNSEELNDLNNLEDIQNVTKTDRENKKIIKKKRSILSEQKKKSTKKEEKQLKE